MGQCTLINLKNKNFRVACRLGDFLLEVSFILSIFAAESGKDLLGRISGMR